MVSLFLDAKSFLKACISNAKAFLRENPSEKSACVAEMFGVHHLTLYNMVARNKKPSSQPKQIGAPRVLKKHQVKAV